ncbi:Tfp pilus assembly protein FimT/FimU [Acinetobacter sp. YH12100]|uniref:pilus assembly FimT family protein n=1 Tax=Acinetobacter sp. YH12100 TaxID=2601089 RepID=UPI0015D2EADB|nr:prepilin-type N-terminal cleavage/methylation domain-containing protein [Acinetobacter sp. YH12100]
MQKNNGFTLIELMVTIGILVILAILAAPSFKTQIYNYELKKELNELVVVLNEAKNKSKLLNQPVSIFFRSKKEKVDPENSLYLELDVNKYEYNMNGEEILFRNNGIVEFSDGKNTLCLGIKHKNSGKAKKIELSRLGLQQLADGSCGGEGV